ncbi:MAG TPA: hypothetical protein VJZ25_00530, partial [Gemmatimonadaceae bacterium]|nr:hypothetical protein [Gemmatimonadaceae bacterium]
MRFNRIILLPFVASLSGCIVPMPAEPPAPARPPARVDQTVRAGRAEIAGENPYGRMESRI